MRLAAPVLVLVLLAAPAWAAGWSQLQGGPFHAGVADLQTAPLDVQRVVLVAQPEEHIRGGPMVVATDEGFLGLTTTKTGECSLLRFTDLELPPERVPLGPCPGGLTGHVASLRLVLVCGATSDPDRAVVEGRDAVTGQLRWALTPARDLAPGSGAPLWNCATPAIDEAAGAGVYAFQAYADQGPLPNPVGVDRLEERSPVEHRIARIDLASGAIVWQTQIPASSFTVAMERPETLAAATAPTGDLFAPWGVALSTTGVVITGWRYCVCGPRPTDIEGRRQGAAVWLDHEGGLVGTAVATEPTIGGDGAQLSGATLYSSNWGASSGALTTFGLGGRIYMVNAAEPRPVASTEIRAVESSSDYYGITGPAWWDDVVLLPLSHSVSAYGAQDLERRWSWTEGPEWDAGRVLVARPSDAYVLNARIADLADEAATGETGLVRLDLASGQVLQRLPLPILAARGDGRWDGSLVPLPDGRLAVVSPRGEIVLLGEADPSLLPEVEVTSRFPSAGETVEVRILPRSEGPLRYLLSWGDGPPANLTGPEAVQHRYVTSGQRVLRVTAVYDDGRTATREIPLDVGGTPPPSNFVAAAFAAENQELTFGVIGIVLTLIGAAVAIVARRRRRSLIDEEFRRLETLREEAARDPRRGSAELAAFAARLRADLRGGRLDDAQFSLLDSRLAQLLRGTRLRVLAPYAPRMSGHYRALLDAALGDGHLTPAEASTLVEALAHETTLTPQDRGELEGIIVGWRTAEPAAHVPR